jgi:hypothetical protein
MFGETLADFKKAEAPEGIYPLLSEPPLCNALVAWRSVSIRYKKASECPVADDPGKWDWLWDQVEFDVGSFGVVAGCPSAEVANMLNRLKGLRLIYPDGSINEYAKQFLASQIIQKISGKRKNAKA